MLSCFKDTALPTIFIYNLIFCFKWPFSLCSDGNCFFFFFFFVFTLNTHARNVHRLFNHFFFLPFRFFFQPPHLKVKFFTFRLFFFNVFFFDFLSLVSRGFGFKQRNLTSSVFTCYRYVCVRVCVCPLVLLWCVTVVKGFVLHTFPDTQMTGQDFQTSYAEFILLFIGLQS